MNLFISVQSKIRPFKASVNCASIVMFATCASAQPGCPDPQALNYNAAAASNDGSCLYPVTTYTPVKACTLSDTLRECSGIAYADNRWWGHNDSGNPVEVHRFDPASGYILQTVQLEQTGNVDWEDIGFDGMDLFVGDFGNNVSGNRTDLGVYHFPLSALGSGPVETVSAMDIEFQPFAYEDQTDFNDMGPDNTVFDCEAMFCWNGETHLFTKDWVGFGTAHYVINPATNQAEKRETFPVGCLITGADISSDGKTVALLGYNINLSSAGCFIWLLWDFQGDAFFSGNKRRIDIGYPFVLGQTEAIGFESHTGGFIGSEAVNFGPINLPPSLWRFETGEWTTTPAIAPGAAERIRVFPNPAHDQVFVLGLQNGEDVEAEVRDATGKICITGRVNAAEGLSVESLPAGMYTAALRSGTRENRILFVVLR